MKTRVGVLIVLCGMLVTYGISHAQNVPGTTLDPFKVISTSTISPRNASNSFQIPSLGAAGTPCIVVNASGTFSTATCGSGGGGGTGTVGPSTSTYVAVFNASGTIAGFVNLTYVSSTNTFTVGGTASTSLSGSTGVASVIGDRLHLTDIYGDTVSFNPPGGGSSEASFGFYALVPELGLQLAGLNSTSAVSFGANLGGGVAVQDISQVNGTQYYIWPDSGGWLVVGTSTVVNHCVKWTGTSTIGDSGAACGGSGGIASTSPFTIGQIVTVSSSGALATNGFKTSDFLPSSTNNGQTNFIPLWTGTSALGTSTMSVTGTTVLQNGTFQVLTLPIPVPTLTSTSSAGSLKQSQAFFFEVTSVDGNNVETPVSAEVTTTTPAGTSTITVSWPYIGGAVIYKAYIATSTGAESMYASSTINTIAFATTTIGGVSGPKATSTPPVVNLAVANQLGTSTTAIAPILGFCGLTIGTTTPCGNQNIQTDLELGHGTLYTNSAVTWRSINGGAVTITWPSGANLGVSGGAQLSISGTNNFQFNTGGGTGIIAQLGPTTTSTNVLNMNGTVNVNALNVTSTATLGSTTINGQATTTNLSVTAVTSSPLAVSASGLLERMTITTTTQSFSKLIDATTTQVTASNTASATTFYTLTVPSSTLDLTGKQLRISAGGTFTFAGPTNPTLTIGLFYGGSTCLSKATGAVTTSTNVGTWFFNLHLADASSTSNQICDIIGAATGGSGVNIPPAAGSTAVDSTVSQTLLLKMTMNSANASNTITASFVNVMLDGATSTVVTGFSFN